ncbi:damage-inducible protein DinB [Bacillus canaveralius]|uniref:Damage-inducible protein DinB n=1 Tax=Bacillus canaveralius TaxID=1403243 RepID=A0A2N5GSU9_9BACI|nr:DinB family protein [Bacillus canaveralius]PLR86843.1 damage-inducible protein DinB [Bacillus canaveralius]PLR93331.1 damage-inducible protein DinB [Bacillus canaveralius]RSK43961.1 damage-inducible protein DinB [Bacillus canaveralius]
MLTLFRYNWQVRDEWFDWCEQLPQEEYIKQRTGGAGSFHETLLHIIDVEYSWIRALEAKSDIEIDFKGFESLQRVRELSERYHPEIFAFLQKWTSDMENLRCSAPWLDDEFTRGEVLRHIIAHEIHHVGQLSVWARDLDLRPVSANLIGRGLMEKPVND